jgi:hypothetical protein
MICYEFFLKKMIFLILNNKLIHRPINSKLTFYHTISKGQNIINEKRHDRLKNEPVKYNLIKISD